MKPDKSIWKWFGHAAHFICGHDCRFHLATLLPSGYLVSTVGEYWPSRAVREIHAESHDPKWLQENQHLLGDYFDAAYMERFGFDTIGYNRKYETMVFKAEKGSACKSKDCGCGLPEIVPTELDFLGYNTAGKATAGHVELCSKWERKANP